MPWSEDANHTQLTTATENVGIGSTTPATRLHLEGTTDQGSTVVLRRSDNNKFMRLGVGSSGAALDFDSSSYLSIQNNGAMDLSGWFNGTELVRITADGKVGIATGTPAQPLDVNGAMALRGPLYTFDGATQRVLIQYESDGLIFRDNAGANDQWWAYLGPDQQIRFLGGTSNNAGASFIIQNGNVGIGTSTPGAKLDVTGNVNISGTVTCHDVLLNPGSDCAEQFETTSWSTGEPGSVMVIDSSGALAECSKAYDKKVAGVISGAGEYKPGILLGHQLDSKVKAAVALVGRVYCKVDAQYGPIEVGDLLTTSPTSGHAMKASEPLRAFGAVLGKAMKSLTSDRGLIPVLVALQ